MKIWGNKTDSLFDIWSIEHFISGVTIGSVLCVILMSVYFPELKRKTNKEKKKALNENNNNLLFHYFTIILLVAYIWEVLEFYMEAGYTGNEKITYWFQGVEFWLNRAVTDPFLVAFGAWVALKFYSAYLSWGARIFSVIWLWFHIIVFPHCMYLQYSITEFLTGSHEFQAQSQDIIIADK